MVNRTYETMQACLLCDFGGILHRAEIGSGRPEQRAADYFSDKLPRSVTEAIRYHRTTLPEEGMDPNSLAHIVRAARDIALGFEAQPDPASDAMPLESIFNYLNQGTGHKGFRINWTGTNIQYPIDGIQNDRNAYRQALNLWEKALSLRLFDPSYCNALLESLNQYFAYVPAFDQISNRQDVSFVYHSKAIAAIGCCIERWLDHRGIDNYRDTLISDQSNLICLSKPQ